MNYVDPNGLLAPIVVAVAKAIGYGLAAYSGVKIASEMNDFQRGITEREMGQFEGKSPLDINPETGNYYYQDKSNLADSHIWETVNDIGELGDALTDGVTPGPDTLLRNADKFCR